MLSLTAGAKVLTRDDHVATVVRTSHEDGVTFAWITYDDGFMPGGYDGRVTQLADGTPVWEHRVETGKVVRSGGDYYNPADWIEERGLRPVPNCQCENSHCDHGEHACQREGAILAPVQYLYGSPMCQFCIDAYVAAGYGVDQDDEGR